MPTLAEWEARLTPQLKRSLTILGEVYISRDEVEELADLIAAHIQRSRSLKAATDELVAHFPNTFVMFLTAFGAHNTEQSYWIALAQRLDISNQNTLFNCKWHKIYIADIKRRRLRNFDFEEAGTPYVATIRFHGGIPFYSLSDFFEHILLPTLDRPNLRELPEAEALKDVMRTSYLVNSAVRNFIENSKALGQEFFSACREMVREYRAGVRLDAEVLGLPAYVVDAFQQFMENEEDRTLRLRKPYLTLSPWDDTALIWVNLPEQQIPLQQAEGQWEWRISWPDQPAPVQLKPRLSRRRQDASIETQDYGLLAAPAQVNVSLWRTPPEDEGDPALIRRWQLPLLPSESQPQLLAFRSNCQALRPGQSLPADTLFLIYPDNASLVFEGAGRCLETYDSLPRAWTNWKLEQWDLSTARSVAVQLPGQTDAAVLQVAARLPEPELIGSYFQAQELEAGEAPLYVEIIPRLRLPLRAGADLHKELTQWQLKLESVWETLPSGIRQQGSAASLEQNLTIEDGAALIDLSAWLGKAPIGTFQLSVLGPDGIRTDIRFRCWPKLQKLLLPAAIFPKAGAEDQGLTFLLRLPEDARCQPQAGALGIQVKKVTAGWDITATPEVDEARLNLVMPGEGGENVSVPVTIPIPRLRWALALSQTPGELTWASQLLSRSLDVLLQSDSSALHLRMSGLGQMVYSARIELIDSCTDEQALQSEKLKRVGASPDWWRVSLQPFRDTLRQSCQEGRFDFVLEQSGKPVERVPLAVFGRGLDIQNVQISQLGDLKWLLTWQEAVALRRRRVLIESAWQPWRPAIEYKIPDAAHQRYEIDELGLPPGRYRFSFYTLPESAAPRLVPPENATEFTIDLGDPVTRLNKIKAEYETASTPDEKFRCAFEEACIYHELGQDKDVNEAISRCCTPSNHLSDVELLLTLLNWMERNRIQSECRSFLLNNLFVEDRLKEVLLKFPAGHPTRLAYLAWAPRVKKIRDSSFKLIIQNTDNPEVVWFCLKQMFNREREDPSLNLGLVELIVEMITDRRLSERDARDLLTQDPRWALNQLIDQPEVPVVGRMITRLLREAGKANAVIPADKLRRYITMALNYEDDVKLRELYFGSLLDTQEPMFYERLMVEYQLGRFTEAQAMDLLSLHPKTSLSVLEQAPDSEQHQDWILKLAERFPEAAGLIQAGSRIKLPGIGTGLIDYIENRAGLRVTKVRLHSPDHRICLLLNEGSGRQRTWLDIGQKTLSLDRAQAGFRCSICGFVNAEQREVERHLKLAHSGSALKLTRMTSNTILINPDTLEILLPKER